MAELTPADALLAVLVRHRPVLLAFAADLLQAIGAPVAAPALPAPEKPRRAITLSPEVRQARAERMHAMRAAGVASSGRAPLIIGERLEALRSRYEAGAPIEDIVAALNALPGEPVTKQQALSAASHQRLKRPADHRARVFPAERTALLTRDYATADLAALLQALNALPGPPLTSVRQLRDKASNLGLARAADAAPPARPVAPIVPPPGEPPRPYRPSAMTAEREAVLRRMWPDPAHSSAAILAAVNRLDGPQYGHASSLNYIAGRLGLSTRRPVASNPAPVAAAPSEPAPAPVSPVNRPAPLPSLEPPTARQPAPPAAAPAVAPAPVSQLAAGEDAQTSKLDKARRMLRDGMEPSLVERHSGVPLREIYRLRGELREADRPA